MLYLFQFSIESIQVTEGRMLVSPVLTHKGHWRMKVKLKLCIYSGVETYFLSFLASGLA